MSKKRYVLLWGLWCLSVVQLRAQAPNLPVKASLQQNLLSNRSFTNATAADTVSVFMPLPPSYTLEVKARVNAASGRGLDLEGRNSAMRGWRLTLDPTHLRYSAPLAASRPITLSRAAEQHVFRIAVRNDSAHIYQNGAYIETQPLSTIKDIVNGAEVNDPPYGSSASLLSNWAGTAPNNTGRPTDYGWGYTGATVSGFFNVANGTSGSRYMDVNATSNTHTLDGGGAYIGRILYIRWDGAPVQSMVYHYPVILEANTAYDFSMLHAYVSNATSGRSITVGIGKTTAVTDRYATHTFATTGTRVLKRENFLFTSQEAGTYYLTFTGDWGLFSIAELALRKFYAEPRFLFGKNYPAGAVNMDISSVTYEEGAYAPAAIETGVRQTVSVTGATASYITSFNTHYVVAGKTDLHLNGNYTPMVNSTVALDHPDAWLFFDNVKPSQVAANWLDQVTINGTPAAGNANHRLAVYKNGTVLIPNGNLIANEALQVFTSPGLAGNTRSFNVNTYHDSLATFDNSVRSFRLRRGYMATLANNPDGSGYSRVFIANDSDLVVNTMPQGLDNTVSFIRVFKWNWVSKKGWAGGGLPVSLTNSTWFYDWNIGGTPTADYDYALIRHNAGWPGWADINSKNNSNTLLGFNEPDQADQANMSVATAIQQWPEMMKSGLRIGSPSPANPSNNWITDFLAKCDSLNYRVDFVAVHCYWNSRTPAQWYSGLKAIYDRVKRPLWITEWNNGANWTGEAWPSDPTAQFEKQYNDLKGILEVLDTTSFVERYSIYNWVENKRAMVLADTLTKAGKYYAANRSNFAYTPGQAFVHNWKLVAPPITGVIDEADYTKVTLGYKDLNGETGSGYVLERKLDGLDTAFVGIHTDTGYAAGSDLVFVDSVATKATYRIKAIGRDGIQFVYSAPYVVQRDATPVPPSSLTGEVLASNQVKLVWNTGTNVRSYNLKRGLSAAGPFETILGRTSQLTYFDSTLASATTYYYVVTTLNSAGESANSTVLPLTTQPLVAPGMVVKPRIASGDRRITLSWDFMYDARYEIQRADAVSGLYTTLATNLNAVRYADTNVVNDHTYHYKIIAVNAAGTGPASSELAGIPIFGQHLHIAFNEATGSLAEDVWGAYHGTLNAGAGWVAGKDSATGGVGLTVAAKSYVQLPEGVLQTINDFTIASWIKLPANQANNTRLFDFGNDAGTFMVLVPRINNNQVRYKITCPAGTYDRYIPYAMPLNEWVHVAISQQGNVFKLYVNGQLQYRDSAATVKPSQMGSTRNNYFGRSQFPNDPYCDHQYDDARIYSYGMNDAEVALLANGQEPLKYQLITLAPMDARRPGDADFVVTASASTGLPLTYTSADTSIAVVDATGTVTVKAAGSALITAQQAGNEQYQEASASRLLNVLPYHLRVDHLNGNGANTTGNSLRPYLKLVNLDTVALSYGELTARYWITPENYTGINTWIDYATLGNKVQAQYKSLPMPYLGAYGYIEYRFDASAGLLAAGGNSGVIQSRAGNTNWGLFSESDDHSYAANTTYASNEHITVYRNGRLIAGTAPLAATAQVNLAVLAANKQAGNNSISATLIINNTGNVALDYKDITVRYWFTAESNVPLNRWIDYAQLGANNVTSTFTRLPEPLAGADAYLELGFSAAAGRFYPLCNTGNIQFRIAKNDWAVFNQADDHSYTIPGSLALNERITVYYKGALIAGVEPSNALLTGGTTPRAGAPAGALSITGIYPNPVRDHVNIRVDGVGTGAQIRLFNAVGVLVTQATLKGTACQLPMGHLPAGVYQLIVSDGAHQVSRKLFKE
ncbi:cellulose binding domain-containing protein [Paraflavitalea pollutisoli]|uniref:cellulose binding domain-containing protein n=1 Tax=Paraflavitalea pollutisoli TaxID=3034143 RepID=UPI0023ED7349|nr:cellulose binding domain-containing protein [Paraflavitalea sp. H1-2-19X]